MIYSTSARGSVVQEEVWVEKMVRTETSTSEHYLSQRVIRDVVATDGARRPACTVEY